MILITVCRTLFYQFLLLFVGISIGFIVNAEWVGWKYPIIQTSFAIIASTAGRVVYAAIQGLGIRAEPRSMAMVPSDIATHSGTMRGMCVKWSATKQRQKSLWAAAKNLMIHHFLTPTKYS